MNASITSACSDSADASSSASPTHCHPIAATGSYCTATSASSASRSCGRNTVFDRVKRALDNTETSNEFLKLVIRFTQDITDTARLVCESRSFLGDGELMAQFREILGWYEWRDRIAVADDVGNFLHSLVHLLSCVTTVNLLQHAQVHTLPNSIEIRFEVKRSCVAVSRVTTLQEILKSGSQHPEDTLWAAASRFATYCQIQIVGHLGRARHYLAPEILDICHSAELMGHIKWRPAELEFLRQQYTSTEVRQLLGPGPRYNFAKAARAIHKGFLLNFGQPYAAETGDEFLACQKLTKTPSIRAEMKPWPAETPDEHRTRLEDLFNRIHNWCKNSNSNRHCAGSARALALPVLDDTRAVCAWDVFWEWLKSGRYDRLIQEKKATIEGKNGLAWTAWASEIYGLLPQEELTAIKEEVGQHKKEGAKEQGSDIDFEISPGEFIRARKAVALADGVRAVTDLWTRETGWVGTVMLTGLDGSGVLQTFVHNFGCDSNDQTFEDIPVKEAQISSRRLRYTLFGFGQDIFDPRRTMTYGPGEDPPLEANGSTGGTIIAEQGEGIDGSGTTSVVSGVADEETISVTNTNREPENSLGMAGEQVPSRGSDEGTHEQTASSEESVRSEPGDGLHTMAKSDDRFPTPMSNGTPVSTTSSSPLPTKSKVTAVAAGSHLRPVQSQKRKCQAEGKDEALTAEAIHRGRPSRVRKPSAKVREAEEGGQQTTWRRITYKKGVASAPEKGRK